MEEDSKLDFSWNGEKCNVSFLHADVLRPQASVSVRLLMEATSSCSDSYIEKQEHGPESAHQQEKRRVCHVAQGTAEHVCDEDGHVPRTEDKFGFQEAGVNQNVEEMRECSKTKRNSERERKDAWRKSKESATSGVRSWTNEECMTQRRKSVSSRPCSSTIQSTK